MIIATDAGHASEETTVRAVEVHALVKLVHVKKPSITTRDGYWVCLTVKLKSPVFSSIRVVTSNSYDGITSFGAFKTKRFVPAIIPAPYSSLIGGRCIIFNFRTFTGRNTVSKRRAGYHIRTTICCLI